MLSGSPAELQTRLEHIQIPEVKTAFLYLVGAAACSTKFEGYPKMHGVVLSFRFRPVDSGDEFYGFITNKKWLTFYFRAPALSAGRHTLDQLRRALPGLKVTARGKGMIKISTLEEAVAVLGEIDL